jgi:hypothetical protein
MNYVFAVVGRPLSSIIDATIVGKECTEGCPLKYAI